MVLKLGFSPCPNDTFIFDALVNRKVDTAGLEFDVKIADVEELNRLALNAELDITKISYHAYAYIAANYVILDSGSALGKYNGPILVSKRKVYPDEVNCLKIAIPGKYTTANLLLGIAYPGATNKKEYLFSDIEEVVLSNEADAGLIIHENRFTYQSKGLLKITDLGEYWEKQSGLPVPLGGIVVNRRLAPGIQSKINRVLKNSIEFAMANRASGWAYIRKYAQGTNDDVISKHIELYVNDYTLDLGATGKRAIEALLNKAHELKLIPKLPEKIFIG